MSFRRAPLAAAALWLALGISLARFVFQPTVVLLAALLLLLLLTLAALRYSTRIAWLPVAGIWIILGFACASWQPEPSTPVALLTYADNLSRTVRAHVTRIRIPPPAPEHYAQAADADPVPPWESVEETSPSSVPLLSIDLAVDAAEALTPDTSTMTPVTGGVRVSIFPPKPASPADPALPTLPTPPDLHCGDFIELPLRLKPPERFRDPGAFQYADLLLIQGIAARASVAADRITLLGASPSTLSCRLFAAQSWASGRLLHFAQSPENRRLPVVLQLAQPDALMLNAMLFGDRSGLTHTLRVGFERTGSFHLFVVSGLHIALLAGLVFWLLRRLRMPLVLATFATIAATAAYAALTGFGQPAQRSLAMTCIFLLARLLSRDRDSLNAVGAAVLAMLLWSPPSLFEASFQMTVLVVLAIGGIAIPLAHSTFLRYAALPFNAHRTHGNDFEDAEDSKSSLEPREAHFLLMLDLWGEALAALLGSWAGKLPSLLLRTLLWILELALIGIVAELVMVLPMAMYFHRAALFALPANMLVIPLIGILAPAAVATFVCSLASPWLALLPGALTAALLHLITLTIQYVSHLRAADVRVPGPVWWIALVALLAWGACCWLVRRGRGGALATAFALPLIAALILWPEPAVTTPGALEVTAIDVGQGDSLLAINPERSVMLIDAGGPVGGHGVSEVVANFNVGEEVVSPYLWSRRLRRVDILVLSHAHTDHMGGMPAILQNFHPRELWVGIDPRSPLYAALLQDAARVGTRVRHLHAGEHLPWGSVDVSILSPALAYTNTSSPRNDDSLVLTLQYGKASVLLEGDAEKTSESTMIAAGFIHPVTLLKVGHHGSRTSSTPEFIAAAAPEDAVISVGRHNTFGHPRPEVLQRLADAGTHVFRTDMFGVTTFLLRPDGSIRETVGDIPLAPGSPHHKALESPR